MKLSFYEKNILDPNSRELVTITTPDASTDDIDDIKEDYNNVYTSTAQTRRFRRASVPVEYLSFFTDGTEEKDRIKKVDLTTGEPQIVRNSVYASSDIAINEEYTVRVDKKKLDEEIDPIETAGASPEPTTTYSLSQTTFIPRVSFEVSNLTTNILEGFSDYSSRINIAGQNNPLNKLTSFIEFLKGNYDYFGEEFAGNFNDTDSLDSIDDFTNSEVERRSASDPAITITHEITTKIPFLNNTRNFTLTYNYQYGIVEETKVKPKALESPSGGNDVILMYPAEQKLKIQDLSVVRDEDATITELETLLNNFEFATTDINFSVVESGGIFNLYADLSANFPGDIDADHSDLSDIVNSAIQSAAQNSSTHTTTPLVFRVLLADSDVDFTSGERTEIENLFSAQLTNINQNIKDRLRVYITNRFEVARPLSAPSANIFSESTGVVRAILNAINFPAFSSQVFSLADLSLNTNVPAGVVLNGVKVADLTTATPSFVVEKTNANAVIEGNSKTLSRFGYFQVSNAPFNLFTQNLPANNPRSLAAVNASLATNPIEISYQTEDFRLKAIDANGFQIVKIVNNMEEQVDPNTDNITQMNLNSSLARSSRNYTGDIVVVNNASYLQLLQPVGNDPVYSQNFRDNFYSTIARTFADLRDVDTTSSVTIQNELTLPAETLSFFVGQGSVTRTYTEAEILALANERQEERQEPPVDLINNVDGDFPFVSINNLQYDDANNRIELFLSRKTTKAPIPNKTFFDSATIRNTTYNFSSSTYTRYNEGDQNSPFPQANVAKYSWAATSDPTGSVKVFDLILRKAGTSMGSSITTSQMVQKSTTETIARKIFPTILSGFTIVDFDFDTDLFKIVFQGDVAITAFSAIRIYDKDGNTQITRDMLPASATRTVNLNGTTTYQWDDYAEFYNLKRNKNYELAILTGANTTENRYFVTRPAKETVPFIQRISTDTDVIVQLEKNSANELGNTPFSTIEIDYENGTELVAPLSISSAIRDNDNLYTFIGSGVTAPAVNSKLNVIMEVEDYPEFEISLVKMTDIYFDTIVILNTNLNDIGLYNSLDIELLHPTDIKEFKAVEEDELRHVVLFLNNSITSQEVKIKGYHTNMEETQRKLGQIILCQSIGEFSQYPKVTPIINKARQETRTMFNKAHVRNLPETINYNISFPPLTEEKDLHLAQTLFERSSDYNEFLVWASSGDLPKIKGLKGFRFVDMIKALCTNEFVFMYADGRFSSAPEFEMNLSQVT